jgi:general secretion pathway protein D
VEDLGLEWTLRTQRDVTIGGNKYNIGNVSRVDVGGSGPALPGGAPTLPGMPVTVPPFQGFSFFLFETDRFLGLLNLYAEYGRVSILSSPHILTSENKTAVINVSTSVAVPTQQVTQVPTAGQAPVQPGQQNIAPVLQNIEFRDAGIVLTVKPRISDKRVVALDVKQTVNEVGPVVNNVSSFIKREAETSVVLHDNQTLVLGGLIQTTRSNTQTGLPGLSRIPVVGFLFGKTVDSLKRTELLLLITPRVIGDPTEARELYDQVRAQRPQLMRNLRTHPSVLKPETAEPAPPRPEESPARPAPAPAPPGGPSER